MTPPLRPRGRLLVNVGICTDHGPGSAHDDCAGWSGASADVGIAAAVAGGATGAGVAAELSVRHFIDAHLGLSRARGVRRNAVTGLSAMNRWLYAQGGGDPAGAAPACSLTALILRGRQSYVVHVGDTRLYRLRDDTVMQLTTDHVTTRGTGLAVVTRALGAEADIRIDCAVEPAHERDRYLLCSGGLHRAVPDRAIAGALRRPAAPQATAELLVRTAQDGRRSGGASALVVDVEALPDADQFDLTVAAALPILPAPRSGAVVDGYRLSVMLSDGRYSRVFRATDETDGRTVVVKFPKPAVGAEPVLRQAFLREAWIAARLNSPYVAEVIEDTAGRRTSLFTVMPLYEGETLERRLRRAPLVSFAEGLEIAGKLAKAVAALHRAGVIHRDIKPDNVLLGPGRTLRLLDLGVARLPGMEDFPAADIPGTPSFLAPEQFAGVQGNEATDQYALGVTIYRLFAGAYPYGEIEPFARPRFNRSPVSLLTYRPDVPAWLDRVLLRSVAARPEERFADVVELLFALEHGALRNPSRPRRRRPLIERDELRFWQVVAALLAMALLLALMRR
jgi:serine/threonine protein phosphatase PrpC